jgi:cobalt-zinc-cadmium efflux system protein
VSRENRLAIVLGLNLLLVASLVLVGLSAHSIGVFAAGADYLADAAAIGVSLFAIWLSKRPTTLDRPHGYPRATAIAALVNAGCLLVLCALVVTEALRRLVNGVPEVHGLPVLIVSAVAATAMFAGALILAGDEAGDDDNDGDALNMDAVLLDTAGDAAAASGVAITGAVILATGDLYWLDPAVALVIAIVVAYHAIALLRRATTTIREPTSQQRLPRQTER